MSFSRSSQKRRKFGSSGSSQVTRIVRSIVKPPKSVPPPGMRALNVMSPPL